MQLMTAAAVVGNINGGPPAAIVNPNTSHNLNLTQQHINAALFNVNSPPHGYSPHPQLIPVPMMRSPKTPVPSTTVVAAAAAALMNENHKNHNHHHQQQQQLNQRNPTELHMAEKLVESAAQQQKSAFQFDTDTPKRGVLSSAAAATAVAQQHQQPPEDTSALTSPSSSGLGDNNKTESISSVDAMLDSGIGNFNLIILLFDKYN